MKVVLYMRYSSDRQTEQSIEGQNRICREFCKKENFEIVNTYVDRASSAFKDTDKRTQFQKMIKDSDKQLWDAVVVYKLDRFARNRYDSATYKAKLKKNGVRVISATENISDNPEGVILEAVLEGMAEFYSKELSQKITRGLYESANKGNSIGGHIPLGYKIKNKKWVIDPETAPIVKEAFLLYSEGKTIKQICGIFSKKGYKTTKGTDFNKNSFHALFRNPKYIGVYKYKDIELNDAVPKIIDTETFRKVQNRLLENKKSPGRGKAKVNYLLSTKLICGHCDSTMVGECGINKNGNVYNYYTCSKRKKQNACNKKAIKKELIEDIIINELKQFLTDDTIEEIADITVKQSIAQAENNADIIYTRNQLNQIEKSISNLIKTVEKGIASESITDRILELEKEKKKVAGFLSELEESICVLEKEHVVWWLSKFCSGDFSDENFCKRMIDLLINSIIVWDEPNDFYKITIAFNLSTRKQKIFRCSNLESLSAPKTAC